MSHKPGDPGSSQPSSRAEDVTATSAIESKTAAQLPPPEKPEAIRTRTAVIVSFWLLIIFLGFPIWWKTTSIYRARLPIQEMIEWADGKVRDI